MLKENTVLVVDDSKENIDALRTILEDEYNVKVALSGESALRVLASAKPDLMLLDVMMTGIDGFTVMEKMKASEELKGIPVVFVTGATEAYNEAKGLALGAVDYLKKPYDETIVKIKVRKEIDNKMHRDRLERLVEKRTAEVVKTQEAVILGMSLLAEGRDGVTGDHIHRIKEYSRILAEKLKELYPSLLTGSDVKNITAMSQLHDIGKVKVPDAVLLKPGKLTPEEFEQIKMHTVFGAEVLRKTQTEMSTDSDAMRIMVEIAESHHEKYDGTGYPLGKKGEEIPISARIVSLADVYDALTMVRPYKRAFTHEEAMDIILKGDGRTEPGHFDPRVLEAFKLLEDDFHNISVSLKGGD